MQALYPIFERVVVQMCALYLPQGFVVTDDASLCNTLEKVTRYYDATGKVLVWSGASENTIFSEPKYNWYFRAWHDWVHIMYGFPFTQKGEHFAMKVQMQHVYDLGDHLSDAQRALCVRILEVEIEMQLAYHERTGKYVENQRAFAQRFLAA